ncbi:transcriptional regulator [Lacrimispora sp.]|uniref:transcriptional regulator n=1 Tax=Lacrimispora sp. TaxID=2719234 RepID=UPI0028A59296|nr:transcriptional regulator [Lacrimispora sp.]
MECRKIWKPYQLTGAIQMYEATGEKVYKDFAITCLSKVEAPEGMAESLPVQDSLACFFALDQTGDEKYRQMIESLIRQNDWTLDFMPFVTAYETRYKRKEHYNEIAALFRGEERLTGSNLIALIETIDQMSEEIYEYYRELKDLFKTAVREKIKELPDSSEALEIGYSILKACNMGVLQREKYGDFGELIWKMIESNDKNTCAGLQEMLKAQYTMLKKQEE